MGLEIHSLLKMGKPFPHLHISLFLFNGLIKMQTCSSNKIMWGIAVAYSLFLSPPIIQNPLAMAAKQSSSIACWCAIHNSGWAAWAGGILEIYARGGGASIAAIGANNGVRAPRWFIKSLGRQWMVNTLIFC
jgi:hypothetical protein